MSRGMKWGLIIGVLAVAAGGGVAYSLNKKKNAGTEVRMEQVARRDLVSAVTASGKIEPKTSVDISADITGRIIRIAVEEGDLVNKGQFLIQIDPAQYQAAVSRAEGVVSSTQATLLQTRANRDQAERAWKRANELSKLGPNLIAPATAEEARTALDVAEATYQATRAQLDQSRASLREAKDNLSKTRLVSPIKGPGSSARGGGRRSGGPGYVLEGDRPAADHRRSLGDPRQGAGGRNRRRAADRQRFGRGDDRRLSRLGVHRAGDAGEPERQAHHHPDRLGIERPGGGLRRGDHAGRAAAGHPARPELHRPGRHRHPRRNALSIPIIALTVRDHERVPNENNPALDTMTLRRPGEREEEGVFLVQNGVANFRPVKVGIAGDEYFEVVEGLRGGETIVAGTYQAIRDLKDGGKVREAEDTTKQAEKTQAAS